MMKKENNLNTYNIDLSQDYKKIFRSVLQYGDCVIRPTTYIIIEQSNRGMFNNIDVRVALLHEMADDFLYTANILMEQFLDDVSQSDNDSYCDAPICSLLPIGYMCRHAIELKLKEYLYKNKHNYINSHKLKELFDIYNWEKFRSEHWYKQIQMIVNEIANIDRDGFHLRYSFGKDFCLYDKESYLFNPSSFIFDTKYIFAVFEQFGDQFTLKTDIEKA